ncbi:MAG: hypothetical protein ACLUFN_05790 [Eubacterium sp.]
MLKKTVDKLQKLCYHLVELKGRAKEIKSPGSNLIKEANPMAIEPENSATCLVSQ